MTHQANPNRFLPTLFGFEKAKNKAHIMMIILIHATGWCLLFILPLMLYPVRINDSRFFDRELLDKSVLVLFFYVNYYFLIPRFFERKKYLAYFFLVFLAFVIYFFLRIQTRFFYVPGPGRPFTGFVDIAKRTNDSLVRTVGFTTSSGNMIIRSERFDSARIGPAFNRLFSVQDTTGGRLPPLPFPESFIFGIPRGAWLMTLNNAISSFSLLLLFGGFIRLAYSFIHNQNEKRLLENANLNAEVNFLKSQINPHFLFNTLNSIYAQAHSRSENTEFSILKLSELLRYVLYDSADNKVDLSKDIQYINNYIDLQKLRLSQKVRINYSVAGSMEGKRIAPLLLITFIENAFKHGISYSLASCVNIDIVIFEKTLTLTVINPVLEKDSFEPGGLGLKNVRRRLELLYPGHKLDIFRNESLHIVNLEIQLTDA